MSHGTFTKDIACLPHTRILVLPYNVSLAQVNTISSLILFIGNYFQGVFFSSFRTSCTLLCVFPVLFIECIHSPLFALFLQTIHIKFCIFHSDCFHLLHYVVLHFPMSDLVVRCYTVVKVISSIVPVPLCYI